jgi:aspartyl-tRNA(Asn)/glutamyl-tRNA(Gln) amidotransferase subunit C
LRSFAANKFAVDFVSAKGQRLRAKGFPPGAGTFFMITDKDVLYVAELANLELTPEERTRFVKDLNSILDYIGRLNELNTDNIPPMAQVSERYGPAEKTDDKFAFAQRDDTPRPCLPHDLAMQNAPNTDGNFFKVPKVIDK